MVGTENTKSKSANFRQHCVPNTLRATKLCKRANVGEVIEAYCHLQGIYSAELGTGAFIGVYLSHLRYSFIFLPTLLELYIRRLTKTKYIIKNVIYAKHPPWPYSHFGRYEKPGKPFVLLHFSAKKCSTRSVTQVARLLERIWWLWNDLLDWLPDEEIGVGGGFAGGVEQTARIFTVIAAHHFAQRQTDLVARFLDVNPLRVLYTQPSGLHSVSQKNTYRLP